MLDERTKVFGEWGSDTQLHKRLLVMVCYFLFSSLLFFFFFLRIERSTIFPARLNSFIFTSYCPVLVYIVQSMCWTTPFFLLLIFSPFSFLFFFLFSSGRYVQVVKQRKRKINFGILILICNIIRRLIAKRFVQVHELLLFTASS